VEPPRGGLVSVSPELDSAHRSVATEKRKILLTSNGKSAIFYTMKTRSIKHADGKGEAFAVSQHIILRNFWEYYLEEPNENGIAFGFVMGFENEWGDVDMNEIKPYIISQVKGTALDEVMAPAGYVWEDEV